MIVDYKKNKNKMIQNIRSSNKQCHSGFKKILIIILKSNDILTFYILTGL